MALENWCPDKALEVGLCFDSSHSNNKDFATKHWFGLGRKLRKLRFRYCLEVKNIYNLTIFMQAFLTYLLEEAHQVAAAFEELKELNFT